MRERPDLYDQAEGLAEALGSEGSPDLAQGIRDAITAGSTGTEILMALRHELEALEIQHLPHSILRTARELRREISAFLR